MNIVPNSNALLASADRKYRRTRAIAAIGWITVFGGLIGCAWFECYLHPIGHL